MNKSLTDKVALVTGGSGGIGRTVCIQLAGLGAMIYVNDLEVCREGSEETVKLCEEAGGSGAVLSFNVAESDSVDAAMETVKEKSGRLDILVNNAGINRDAIFVRTRNEDWDRVLAVNLTGAFYCSRAAAKLMMKKRYGRIINISSVVGEMGNAGQAAYVSSKAGLLGLTKTLARELAVRNITVNAITPGFIETDMTAKLDETVKNEHLKAIPLGRYGQPEDIANMVAFLASDRAGYITGQGMRVNGGMYM
jgi:3-oxoacyl-[acyl-carrier protein] reductase